MISTSTLFTATNTATTRIAPFVKEGILAVEFVPVIALGFLSISQCNPAYRTILKTSEQIGMKYIAARRRVLQIVESIICLDAVAMINHSALWRSANKCSKHQSMYGFIFLPMSVMKRYSEISLLVRSAFKIMPNFSSGSNLFPSNLSCTRNTIHRFPSQGWCPYLLHVHSLLVGMASLYHMDWLEGTIQHELEGP